MKKIVLLFTLVLVSITTFAQRFAGIEIGGKGIKVAVIDIINVDDGSFNLVKDWTRNTAVTKNITAEKLLAVDDMTITANAVAEIYGQLLSDHNVKEDKIFIAGSSGVALAKNTDQLAKLVKDRINKDMFFINSEMEGKLVTKGGVPAKRYTNSFVWDIGGGNSKGGFVLVDDGGYYVFAPMAFDYGCVTLTEKIKYTYKSNSYDSFKNGLSRFLVDTLKPMIIDRMFDNQPAAKRKQNFYAIGGASWAFTTLMFPERFYNKEENYIPFKTSDVQTYYLHFLNNDFDKWVEVQREKNPEAVDKVLNAYDKQSLLVGATLLNTTMTQMNNPDKLNCYFVKKGQVAWIIAYVVDYVRKNKGQ